MKGLVKVLEDQITESESGSSEVGEQRERNHRYYTLQPIGNEQKGRSQYVSPDVMDGVDSKKSLFDETFLSARQVCKFKNSPSSPFEADAKTAYTNRTFRKNKHHQLFRDGWHDAFVAKRMVVLVEWERDSKLITMPVSGAQQAQVQQMIQQQGNVIGVDGSRLQAQTMPGMQGPVQVLSGEVDVELDDSYAKITLITPERYYRDPEADYPETSQWCSWEDDIARGDLVMDGYDEDQVMGLAVDYRFRSNEEDSARKSHDSSWTRRQQYDRVDSQSHVTVYKTWTWLNLTDAQFADFDLGFEPEDEIALYKICWAHGEVLKYQDGPHAVEIAEAMPFVEWTEKKISHAEHGMCTADILAHPQKTNSTLKRLILDNQQMRNNTRYEAVLGALKNPRDLLDNKIGATLWSRQIGSVAPLATPELSPLTFNVLQMMQQDVEKRDGYSALGKGMNGDAVRYQNAESMVERLTSAGTRRPMSSARDWANNFLIPLSQMIVTLAMEHDKSQSQLEVRGRMVPVVPSKWQDDVNDMEVATALTPQEGKEHGQMLLTMHSVIMQDPDMQPLYTVQHKHALFDAVFDAMGVEDTTPFLARPDSPEFQKQQAQAQQEAKKAQAKQEALVVLDGKLKQSADRRAWEMFQWQQTSDMAGNNLAQDELAHKRATDKDKSTLDWTEFAWQQQVDVAEVKLERQQRRPVGVGN